ncbi:MAG: hypothetical protein VW362_08585, partial [Candidatus Nanopelagicales bacterium]
MNDTRPAQVGPPAATDPAALCGLSDPFDPDRSLNLNRRHWPGGGVWCRGRVREPVGRCGVGGEAGGRRGWGALGAR